jgi:hypothetical protein
MDPRFVSAMSQWFMYFLPTIVAWLRVRMGKKIVTSVGSIFFYNLILAWTGVMWIILMLNAFNLDPLQWVILKLVKFVPRGGAAPMNAPQAAWGPSSQGQICGQCGGSGTVPCPQCQGPRQLVHSAHHCSRGRATPNLLLLLGQRSNPLPILRRPRLAAPAFFA